MQVASGLFAPFWANGNLAAATSYEGPDGLVKVQNNCPPLVFICAASAALADAEPGAYRFDIDLLAGAFTTAPACWVGIPWCFTPPTAFVAGADVRLP